jgi:hypothetical protein
MPDDSKVGERYVMKIRRQLSMTNAIDEYGSKKICPEDGHGSRQGKPGHIVGAQAENTAQSRDARRDLGCMGYVAFLKRGRKEVDNIQTGSPRNHATHNEEQHSGFWNQSRGGIETEPVGENGSSGEDSRRRNEKQCENTKGNICGRGKRADAAGVSLSCGSSHNIDKA